MTGEDDDPDARRYAPLLAFAFVLALFAWSAALYRLGAK